MRYFLQYFPCYSFGTGIVLITTIRILLWRSYESGGWEGDPATLWVAGIFL